MCDDCCCLSVKNDLCCAAHISAAKGVLFVMGTCHTVFKITTVIHILLVVVVTITINSKVYLIFIQFLVVVCSTVGAIISSHSNVANTVVTSRHHKIVRNEFFSK